VPIGLIDPEHESRALFPEIAGNENKGSRKISLSSCKRIENLARILVDGVSLDLHANKRIIITLMLFKSCVAARGAYVLACKRVEISRGIPSLS